MLQRGGSNVYFSKIASSILIPPYSDPISRVVNNPRYWDQLGSSIDTNGQPDRVRVDVIAGLARVDEKELYRAVRDKINAHSSGASDERDEEYRAAEYRALLGPGGEEKGDFVLKTQSIQEYGQWVQRYFKQIIRVEKLAETRVLTGFSRINPPSPDVFDQADIGRLSILRRDWLPGTRVYGEGVFLTLDDGRLAEWEARAAVRNRVDRINKRLATVALERGRPPRAISGAFLLIHAIAHALIRRLSFECGYGSSALRERIYCGPEVSVRMSGLLIYTAAGDAEGTLGGLVRQARPERLESLLERAIGDLVFCSSDPLCIESNGQGTDSLNLAACHACLLLPETSCEEGNRLLDRALLVGTSDDPSIGFFEEMTIVLLKE